jgi:hypothetical protein
MDDPDPSQTQAVPQRWRTEYRLAHDAAFDVLRSDLAELRGGPDAAMQGRAGFVLGRLDDLKVIYRRLISDTADGCVPSDTRDWTLADELKILRHLAVIIHDRRLARAVFGDEYRIREFWEYGHLRSVENMCHDARQDLAMARSGDLKELIENWAPRQASEAAELTSGQPVPPCRSRPRSTSDQPKQTARRTRTAAARGPARRRGR